MKGLNHTGTIPAAIPVGVWRGPAGPLCTGCAHIEVFDEGDGNWLVRSSFNRDRTLRLTREEIKQLVGIALFAQTWPAPEMVH